MYCKICHVRKPSAHSERLESMRWWVSVTQILLGISMYIHAIPLSMKFRYLERTTALLLRLELKVCSMLMVYRMDFLPKHFCQIYSISGLWDFIFFKFKNKTKKNLKTKYWVLFAHIIVHSVLHAFHTPSKRLQFLENWYIGEIPHPCILTRCVQQYVTVGNIDLW